MLLEKQITYQGKAIRTNKGIYTQALFIWSQVPETTLPPMAELTFHLFLTVYMRTRTCLGVGGGGGTRVGELSRLGR